MKVLNQPKKENSILKSSIAFSRDSCCPSRA